MNCPICRDDRVQRFLDRRGVPVHQNMLCDTLESAVTVPRGDLRMEVCPQCGFIFNSSFDEGVTLYGPSYDNNQTYSPSFARYISGLVEDLIDRGGVRGCRIIEVGCGKGFFIRQLVENCEDNTGIGFDPSYVGESSVLDGRLSFERGFYDESQIGTPADVVICRHVIEHVRNPLRLLKQVRVALASSPDARVLFETPCVDWILDITAFWDFFYEHCSLFNRASMTTAFELSGYDVVSLRHTFGGQYMWLEAKPSNRKESQNVPFEPGDVAERAIAFGERERAIAGQWLERVDRETHGPMAVWGAGAKGVTFLNLIDPNRKNVSFVVDLNPHKQGHFVPGTGHRIVRPEEVVQEGIERILVMNPNYLGEIKETVNQLGAHVEWM